VTERSDIDPGGLHGLAELEERLRRARRQPPAPFRTGLRGRFEGRAPRPRPHGLRRLVAAYAGAGTVLLLLGALGAAGVGPFGP
jgi:hypothetical protein